MIRLAPLAFALLAAGLGTARAENVVKGPDGLSINCDDFRLYPNGTIEANKEATAVKSG